MKNINLEQAFENLINNHTILNYEKDGAFYFLEIPNYPFTELLVDFTFFPTINIVGKTKSFDIDKENIKKLLFSYILTDNTNHKIVEGTDFMGKWIFEPHNHNSISENDCSPTATAKFTYVAEIPNNVSVKALEDFFSSAIHTFLLTRNRLTLFADTPLNEITYDLLGFPESEFSDIEVFISPDFEKFLKDYKKGDE